MVARPAVITTNSPLGESFASQGRMSSGASTMPTKTLAAVAKPVAPSSPKARLSNRDIPATATGSTRQ